MPGKRIPDLTAIAGASTANDDNLVLFDTDANTTKRILRSQLAAGLVGDLPYTPSGGISATTVPTAIAELDSEAAKSATLAAAGGAALIGNTPAGTIAATTVQGAINEIVSDLAASSGSSLVGFLQSGSSAISRTSQAKLRETVSVKDFGAVGDGVTDDTTAFTAALAAATVVFVPQGTYRVENIDVPSNKSLIGAGRRSILKLKSASILRVIVMNSRNDWEIGNLTLDADTTGTSIALFTSCLRGRLFNVWATGSAAHGVEFDACGDCTVDGLEVYSTGTLSSHAALYLKNATASGARNRVTNVRFRSITGRGLFILGNNYTQVDGLYGQMTNGESLLIESAFSCVCNNVVHVGAGTGTTSGDGIAINGNSFYNVINGFHVVSNSGHGVSINGGTGMSGAAYNSVGNGTVVGPSEGGVLITDAGVAGSIPTGNVVANVVVQNCGATTMSEAFGVTGGTDNQFVNCTAQDTRGGSTRTTHGFYELAGGSGNVPARNSFTGRLIGPFSTAAYDLASATSSVHDTKESTTKTYVTFDGDTSDLATIIASSNVASVTRNSEGNYTIALTEGVKAGSPVTITARNFQGTNNHGVLWTTPTGTSITIQVCNPSGTAQDSDYVCVTVG